MSRQGKSNEELVKSGDLPHDHHIIITVKVPKNIPIDPHGLFQREIHIIFLRFRYMFAFNDVIMNHNVANPIINHPIHQLKAT